MLTWEKTKDNTKQQNLLLMGSGSTVELLETSNSQNIQHKSPFLDCSLESPTHTVILGSKVPDQRLALPPKPVPAEVAYHWNLCSRRLALLQETSTKSFHRTLLLRWPHWLILWAMRVETPRCQVLLLPQTR